MKLKCPKCGYEIDNPLTKATSKGGKATVAKHGKDHMSKIAKLRWSKAKKEAEEHQK